MYTHLSSGGLIYEAPVDNVVENVEPVGVQFVGEVYTADVFAEVVGVEVGVGCAILITQLGDIGIGDVVFELRGGERGSIVVFPVKGDFTLFFENVDYVELGRLLDCLMVIWHCPDSTILKP